MKTQHDGDCAIYNAIRRGEPENGICNCGYGLEKYRQDNDGEMYSEELRTLIHAKTNRGSYWMPPPFVYKGSP